MDGVEWRVAGTGNVGHHKRTRFRELRMSR